MTWSCVSSAYGVVEFALADLDGNLFRIGGELRDQSASTRHITTDATSGAPPESSLEFGSSTCSGRGAQEGEQDLVDDL